MKKVAGVLVKVAVWLAGHPEVLAAVEAIAKAELKK